MSSEDQTTEEYLITATVTREIDPEYLEDYVVAEWDPDAHAELQVIDPETSDVVWDAKSTQEES